MCKKNRILDKYSHAPLEAQLSMKTSLKPFVSMSEKFCSEDQMWANLEYIRVYRIAGLKQYQSPFTKKKRKEKKAAFSLN